MNHPTVTAIIPAYNEEKTIASVVRTACASSFIRDVIVVSDGSVDRTAEFAREAGATVFDLQKNGGKGQAMLYGFQQTDAEIILFLDADLIGLSEKHLEQLLKPVIDGTYSMNVGMRDRGRFFTALAHRFPIISGERAMRREILELIPSKFMNGFMVEIAFNHFCEAMRYPFGTVDLTGLSIRRKYQKVGFLKAVVQYLRMFIQIVRAMITVRFAK